MTRLALRKPPNFNFWRTVYSHGWCSLPPFRVDKENEQLLRVLRLSDGSVVACTISDSTRDVVVSVSPERKLTPTHKAEIQSQIRACFRIDEDFSDFFALTRKLKGFRWISRTGAGRLLRAPTVFEDIIKTICTTNCSWALTETMVQNLTAKLGTPLGNGIFSFPTAHQMAAETERFYRKEIRSGYRSPYLLEFAKQVASGRLDVETWRTSSMPTDELFRLVGGIKGMGEYATGSLLRLLGRYDYLALDSWVRSKFSELYHNGRKVSDRTIERAYSKYGQWRGLIFWMDMTKEWMTEKFPF